MNMNKDKIRRIAAKIILLIAIGLLCWPAISHISFVIKDLHASASYEQSADSLKENEYADVIELARQYNDSLVGDTPHVLTNEEMRQYMSLMNITGNGVMGRISIPKINVELPIFHGDDDAVMQKGAEHMAGTSLPVISSSSHVVIAGHTGLPGSTMFNNLPELEIGDTFQITALQQVLVYEVDQIQTVWPDEVDKVAIEQGKEYCTLVTCTPFGVNDHRLLVRGHRIEINEGEDSGAEAPQTVSDVLRDVFRGKILAVYEVVMLAIAMVLLIAEFIFPLGKVVYRRVRKKSQVLNEDKMQTERDADDL